MIQIELKSIRVNQRLSQETFNYSAKLYADGQFVAEIGNDGHGGADRVLGLAPGVTHRDLDAIEARVKAEHPKEDLLGDGRLFDRTLESVCHELVDEHLTAKAVARILKTNVAFFKEGMPAEGQTANLYTSKVNTRAGATVANTAALLKQRHPKAYILNEQPEAEAIAAYKRAA